MTTRSSLAALLLCLASSWLPVRADDDREWRDHYGPGPCEEKVESKPGELKREVKCEDGVGATWHGEWKEEFRDGPCEVKIEASREVFKEEIKCEEHD